MAQKIQQAMVALSEDSRDMKMALRMMLKYEVQMLLERLHELGDDSLLLLANGSEGTTSHLGTPNGNVFLNNCQSMCQLNLKETFLQACSSNSMSSNQDNQGFQGNTITEGLLGYSPARGGGDGGMSNMSNMSGPKFPGKQLGYESNRNHPYNNNFYNAPPGQSGNAPQMNNRDQQGPHSMGRKRNYNKDEVTNIVNSNHKICVNFLQKGDCQKGNSCGFIHTQDEVYIASLIKKPMPDGAAGSTTATSGQRPQLTDLVFTDYSSPGSNIPAGKRKICRHYARGHCWMGNSCSFLHVMETPEERAERERKEGAEETT